MAVFIMPIYKRSAQPLENPAVRFFDHNPVNFRVIFHSNLHSGAFMRRGDANLKFASAIRGICDAPAQIPD